jgi:IS5 family transposase
LTGEIAERARLTVRQARRLAQQARAELERSEGERGEALVTRLERELEAAEQVLAQTDRRLAGERTIADRRVSLVDADARPIRRGNPREPTEFGYKARIADTPEGFVIADVPECGNPRDDTLLDGAIAKAKASGMRLRSVFADRAFASQTADQALARHGITDAVIPRQKHAAPHEHTRAWKRRYRFRNGAEGRISHLKRRGMGRSRLRGHAGARTWVTSTALAHNLQRLAALS